MSPHHVRDSLFGKKVNAGLLFVADGNVCPSWLRVSSLDRDLTCTRRTRPLRPCSVVMRGGSFMCTDHVFTRFKHVVAEPLDVVDHGRGGSCVDHRRDPIGKPRRFGSDWWA